jgi:predicted transposase/invertase (TIGR01784 family)
MKHAIDPKIDCVFKALLGAEANQRLLVHFLNAMLGPELPAPVEEVAILNPYNEREFLDDKLSVVDVKARDALGRLYQIEIQLLVLPDLPARILYGWADLYSAQLASGEDYSELKPTYAIWLLGETLLPQVPGYAHRYRLRDEQGRGLVEHGGIALFELRKFTAERVQTEEQRWLKFFIEGEGLDAGHLPEWMQTEEMRQAMGTLTEFSEKERAYHAYQARQNYLRQQRSIEKRLEALMAEAARERAEKERERAEKEQARAAEEQARAEQEQARMAEERERAEKQAALQREEAALAEIARLKALIKDNPTD